MQGEKAGHTSLKSYSVNYPARLWWETAISTSSICRLTVQSTAKTVQSTAKRKKHHIMRSLTGNIKYHLHANHIKLDLSYLSLTYVCKYIFAYFKFLHKYLRLGWICFFKNKISKTVLPNGPLSDCSGAFDYLKISKCELPCWNWTR